MKAKFAVQGIQYFGNYFQVLPILNVFNIQELFTSTLNRELIDIIHQVKSDRSGMLLKIIRKDTKFLDNVDIMN